MHLRTATLVILLASTATAATTYRTTKSIRRRLKTSAVVQRVTADGDQRRLVTENPEEPFAYDVLLSDDGGASVTALNSHLHTWYVMKSPSTTSTSSSPFVQTEITDRTTEVMEESGSEPIGGYPVRKFVIRASYTSRESYGGTIVKRSHTLTGMIWSTDRLSRQLAFPPTTITMGERSMDAAIREKIATIPGFPLRVTTTVARAYDGGEPIVEMRSEEVDQVATIPAPTKSLFVRPASYVNQEPLIGGPGKQR